MSRKNLRRSGGEQSMENTSSQLDVCEPITCVDQEENEQLSSSSNTPLGNIPKAIPTNEADMVCTTVENVSHVRFEWTVEDFYPQMYECGDMIQSEEFPPYDLQKEFWTLRLYPKGYQRSSTSNEDDSAIPFYLTLCPSHVSSSNQLQIHFRALVNFSNPQGRILHSETVQSCGGNITDEIVLMKMANSAFEEFYKEPIDHLIISIELVSIDDIAKRSMKTSTTKVVDGSSRVVSKVMKLKLRWKIEKFSILVNESSNNSFIESCEFTFNKPRNNPNAANVPDDENEEQQLSNGTKSTHDIPSHQWSLILYPNGKTERFKGSLSIFLEHTFGASVRVVIRFSLIDGRGRKLNTKQLPSHVLAVGERWGVGDFLKHSMILQNQQELIPGNELRVYCQIKILERQSIDEKKFLPRPLVRTKTNRTTTINDDPATYWPSLFYSAYLDKKMFDMHLKCDGDVYNVHKLILALRSSVLAKLIKEKEGTTSSPTKTSRHQPTDDSSLITIEINDIDRKTIPSFLEYLYTGGIKKLAVPGTVVSHTLVIDLLTIANNYDIPDLRTYAEYYLKDVLRVDNACELLVLSDTIKSETLKQTACDFIANNLGNIMETTGWSELKAKQADLIDIILKSCLLLRK